MTEERKHPTHRRHTYIAVFLCAAVGMLGGGLVWLVQDRPDSLLRVLGMRIGISLFFFGCLAFIATSLWSCLVVRCPHCGKFIFEWGISYPEEKTFYCTQCDIDWNTGIVVGGPD